MHDSVQKYENAKYSTIKFLISTPQQKSTDGV